MKKLLFLFCTALIMTALVVTATAYSSGYCGDNLAWTLDDNGTLTISGTGEMYNWGYESPWKNYSIKTVIIDYGVTSISDMAFWECESLTSIEIPDSVTSIGDEAFYYCKSLTSIEIPDSVTSIGEGAFWECECLTSIEIPDSVTSIGNWAFWGCTALASIEIPNSVTSIGDMAFFWCESLTSIKIPDSVMIIGDHALGYTYDDDLEDNVLLNDFTIYGAEGSAAEEYAVNNDIQFVAKEIRTEVSFDAEVIISLLGIVFCVIGIIKKY